jgi:ABC-type glycerol-3-phosphate transport system substrate-binding protein
MMASRLTRSTIIRGGAALLAGSALAACGQTGGEGTAGGGAGAPAKRPVTLLIDNDWVSGDRLVVVNKWLERANRVYPHIKTELRDNASSQEKTIALFASNQQGDLFQLDQHMVPVFGPKGLLYDLTSTLASLKFDANSIYDVNNITHWEGKRHGMIVQLNVSTGVYNRNAFAEAGVKEPTAAWTWDDYLETAKKLHRPVENRWGTSVDYNYPYAWYWSANVPYMDAKGTKTSFDSAPSREILQWLVDLVQRHRVAPSAAENTEKKLRFGLGNFALSYGTVPTPNISKEVEGKFAWQIMPVPKHPKTGKAVVLTTGHNYLVTKQGATRGVATEAAQVLIEFFDKEVQDLYLSGLNVGSLPILKSAAARVSQMPGMPDMSLALGAVATGQNFDKVVGFLDFHRALGAEVIKAYNGEASVEQAAVNMTRASDAALQQAAR